ncbi:hypothetical protein [Leptolyngbya sp. KIOST-1]|uniref:hypothetical protein n=1 Tax=Leptolyngbya sp. KIOST-1 TaxID=1229172 RepID=UPI00056A750D|nr:hypothetical protein [Leptolyngbya sp. KIOST-1]
MKAHSIFDWVSVLGPILLSWPLLITVVLLFFYRPLFSLLEKFSNSNIQKAKIGPVELEESKQTYVESLKLLLTSFVSESELHHLQQLDTDQDAESFDHSADLIGDLKRLTSLGFVSAKSDLDQLPEGGNLTQHVNLTPQGKKYLALRESLLADESVEAESDA